MIVQFDKRRDCAVCRWVDAKNSTEVTRKWYASHLRFPLNLYYPSAWEEAAQQRLAAVCDFDAPPEAVESEVSRAQRDHRTPRRICHRSITDNKQIIVL